MNQRGRSFSQLCRAPSYSDSGETVRSSIEPFGPWAAQTPHNKRQRAEGRADKEPDTAPSQPPAKRSTRYSESGIRHPASVAISTPATTAAIAPRAIRRNSNRCMEPAIESPIDNSSQVRALRSPGIGRLGVCAGVSQSHSGTPSRQLGTDCAEMSARAPLSGSGTAGRVPGFAHRTRPGRPETPPPEGWRPRRRGRRPLRPAPSPEGWR